jgi:hypothetical protein
MRKLLAPTRVISFAAGLIALCCPAALRADPGPFQLYTGVFSPSSADARTFANTEFLIGGIYDINHPEHPSTPYVSGYIGYAGGSNGPASQGNFWVGAQVRTPQQIYIGGGTGFYDSWGSVRAGSVTVSSGQGGLGGVLFVGGDFGKTHSGPGLRAGYDFMPSFSGTNPSGWEIALTYRF